MSTTSRAGYSFSLGAKITWRGITIMARQKPLVFVWINVFSTWFVGGGALMVLSELIDESMAPEADPDALEIDVTGLSDDSREIERGDTVFAPCIPVAG